ncbi:MAG: PilZ domain-containing protein [Methylococcales bacterium]|nr:PilZ domain-containing protein [Methylococcales bacterium]
MVEVVKKSSSGIATLTIKEKKQLYKAYMPFIENGGLFIPTKRPYKMGEEVLMLLSLMEEKERIPLAGKVIWKSPEGSDGHRAAGIGIQLNNKDGGKVKDKIEAYLAGALELDRATHTM